MSKLKPCPFCGSEAADPVFIGNDNTRRRKVTIRCKAPGCTQGVTVAALRFNHDWCHQEAVEKWNTRTVDDELTAAKARIAELEQALEPFADAYHQLCKLSPDGFGHASDDFRRAAALLKDK